MEVPREVAELLAEQRLCVLCTSSRDRPHASLMAFTYLPEEGAALLATRRDTRKSENMESNPRVSLLVFRANADVATALSCTISGTAAFIPDEEGEMYRELHRRRHPGTPSFTKDEALTFVRVIFDGISLVDAEDRVRRFPT